MTVSASPWLPPYPPLLMLWEGIHLGSTAGRPCSPYRCLRGTGLCRAGTIGRLLFGFMCWCLHSNVRCQAWLKHPTKNCTASPHTGLGLGLQCRL